MGVRRRIPMARSYAPESGVAADFPVRDGDAEDADRQDARDRERVGAAVDHAAPAEVREHEHHRGTPGEPAQVAADRDARHGEGEREVDDDEGERAAAEDVVPLTFEYERGAQDAEDRP